MAELSNVKEGNQVLEPSAGNGALLRPLATCGNVVAVEKNTQLARYLRDTFESLRVINGDFLELAGNSADLFSEAAALGFFDVILMNPPFDNAQDIAHIEAAYTLLNKGGRLVAICANGPRQNDQLKPTGAECPKGRGVCPTLLFRRFRAVPRGRPNL
jgi:protein-L-isoaspartate O-methyltransferase